MLQHDELQLQSEDATIHIEQDSPKQRRSRIDEEMKYDQNEHMTQMHLQSANKKMDGVAANGKVTPTQELLNVRYANRPKRNAKKDSPRTSY